MKQNWQATIQLHFIALHADTHKIENITTFSSSISNMDNGTNTLSIENLPDLVLEEILSKLEYHDVATFRRINKRFNNIGSIILNKGYKSTKMQHTKLYKAVKTEVTQTQKTKSLNYHVLLRHYDILTTIGSHLTLLDNTFLKYTSLNLCCFIPGRVIDEMLSIFQTIQEERQFKHEGSKCRCSNAFKHLKRCIDASHEAINHFSEKIIPTLKEPTA